MTSPRNFFAWLPAWSPMKWYLVFANVVLVTLLIILANTHVVPLTSVNFLFFFFVTLLFALYRPGWTFLFLIGLLPLEIINLAPEGFGLNIRPYQWASLVLTLGLGIRFAMKRMPFSFFRLRWFDFLLFLLPLGAFLSALAAPAPLLAFKQAVVVASFFLLYLLFRQYLQTVDDIRQTLPFFFGTSAVVIGYALWQNIRAHQGQEAFAVMAGRPNSVFTEADWLGMFVLFLLLVLWTIGQRKWELLETSSPDGVRQYFFGGPWPLLFFFFHTAALIVLLIAVSRSAWLGTFAAALLFTLLLLFTPFLTPQKIHFRRALFFLIFLFSSLLLALGLTTLLRLTPFPLFDRIASTATGLQQITIACERAEDVPERIENTEELEKLGCRHILLEEKESLAGKGLIIREITRPDPNIHRRAEIYDKTRTIIHEHAILGIGWGSIGSYLGRDERGAALNGSNVFAEVWLGSGLIGLVGFTIFLLSLFYTPLASLFRGKGERSLFLFVVTATLGLAVFNLFNSGILLGFFFLYLALGAALLETSKKI